VCFPFICDDALLYISLTKAAFCKAEYLQMYDEAVPAQAKLYVDGLKICEDIRDADTHHLSMSKAFRIFSSQYFSSVRFID
jgi:hypothetical protein